MTEQTISYIIYGVLSLIITVVTALVGVYTDKYKKERANTNNTINWLDIIDKLMPELIVKYESIFTRGKGEEKKTLVLNELIKYCIDNKITYNEEVLSGQIDNYVKLSKQINRGR